MKAFICFDDWEIDTDTPFGSGASKKHWLVNYKTNRRGIFKYPKITSSGSITGEYWAESLAYEIANLLEIPCAKIDMGIYNGCIGSMSYMMLEKNETLIEGVSFLAKEYPAYNPDEFIDAEMNMWYSLQMILYAIKETGLENDFLRIPIFDALIGNSDRHHSNWGIVTDAETQRTRLSPLYDNGSSLCAIVNEAKINLADRNWINALIETRSRSRIRIENAKAEPTHFQVLGYLAENNYSECIGHVNRIEERLTDNKILELINDYPDTMISLKIKELLFIFLKERRNRIIAIFPGR